MFELRESGSALTDAAGQVVHIELSAVYPLLKSSDLARGRLATRRRMLVTQTSLDADPEQLRGTAPAAWAYLESAADRLAARRSSIYRGRHRFAQFGVGPYTFIDWKVAVSGLYKQVQFQVIGPFHGQPVVFDDTCYFLPCPSEDTASRVGHLLDSTPARGYLRAFMFSDAKRPITAALLSRLDLDAVARYLGEQPTGLQPSGWSADTASISLLD
ncbi:hypothetical protein [Brasilonema bromeliae]|uniref:hypothetical protein n=1 Tax=Brasilonema bromeliae TaxID=383615 RepID=UPI00145C979F